MVRSSKEKKSEISSLFSIEVGSTQITDGFKQLRDYYSRLLDDDTELRKEIEINVKVCSRKNEKLSMMV